MFKTKKELKRILDLFYQKCKANQLKITPQRVAVYRALKDCVSHPSAEKIARMVRSEFPNISLDTINRTLLTFSNINLIDIIEGYGEARRFEPNLDMHHHFYCMECNEVFDIHDESLNNIKLPETVENQFHITTKRLCLKGFCNTCRNIKQGNP